MKYVCLIWNFHQPYRVGNYQVFDVGNSVDYFDGSETGKNKDIIKRAATLLYKPLFNSLRTFSEQNKGASFGVTFSGTLLDQLDEQSPETLSAAQHFLALDNFEMLATGYHFTPAFWYSETEFNRQVKMHRKKVRKLFNRDMELFFNARLPFARELAIWADKQKYKAIIAHAPTTLLTDISPHRVYKPQGSRNIDFITIAPQSVITEKSYAEYLAQLRDMLLSDWQADEVPIIALDIEEIVTKGSSVREAVAALYVFLDELRNQGIQFVSPTQRRAMLGTEQRPLFSIPPEYQDAALYEWNMNSMQREALSELYALEDLVKRARNAPLIESWRRLQAVNHFLAMDTAGYTESSGLLHSLHDSPYDTFIAYMNVLKDIEERARGILEEKRSSTLTTKIPIRISTSQ